MNGQPTIILRDVSKFYGEVLGVNQVSLTVEPGITSLVGPNGAGKSTLLNLMAGLIRPTRGQVEVFGQPAGQPETYRRLGYCTQHDAFPRGMTGRSFVAGYLGVHGISGPEARQRAASALAQVGLTEAAGRRIGGYSKGMRQRVKLAQALAHGPSAILLDEPLNGLDPMARAECIDLFQTMARDGLTVVISSHVLHEVDLVSDRVILMNHGYVVAEGAIPDVRREVVEHPAQVLVRCDRPARLAARLFERDHVVEVRLHPDGRGLLIRTADLSGFHLALNRAVLEEDLRVEAVQPADDDVQSLYDYLIGHEGGTR